MADDDIELEYNPRRSAPDFDHFTQRAASLSQKAREKWSSSGQARLDLRFGDSPLSTLDVFVASEPNAPLHVFLHGGYWRARDKYDYSYIADALVPHGITTAIVNYDLCPAVELPRIVEQVREAFRWLHANASEFGADKERITASGHSAGAHLLAAALSQDDSNAMPQSALLISGIYELEPVLGVSVNEDIRLREEQVDPMSPMRHPPIKPLNLSLAVGAAETRSWVQQTHDYSKVCTAAGTDCMVVEIPQTHHFSVMTHFETPTGWLSRLAASLSKSPFA